MGRLRWFILGFSVGTGGGAVIARYALDYILTTIRKYLGS